MSKKQPVKFKKFRCPPLSASRKEQIKMEANVACDDLLKFSAGDLVSTSAEPASAGDGLVWEYEEQLEGVRIEKVKVKSDHKKSIHYYRGLAQVEASVEEILALYEVDIEHPNVQLETKLAPDLLHSVILYEITPYNASDNTVFIGIRWSAMKTPYVLVRNRDYCYLEIQRLFTLPDGRRGFARCTHSVKIKSCPDMEESHGFVRASMYRSGMVFVESRRDRRILDVVQAVYTDLKGNVPTWVAASTIRSRMMNLEHLKKHVSMKRVANQSFARRSEMMSRGNIKTCFVCVDDIGTFKRKYNCHKCGEVICGRCKVNMSADIPVVGKMKLTICTLCSLAINRSMLPEGSGSGGESRALGGRAFSVTPARVGENVFVLDQPRQRGVRPRALSLNSFHTANFDQTTIQGSMLAAEI